MKNFFNMEAVLENYLGDKIYKARKAKGFSQEYLAELVGVSRQTISQWENDKFQPNNDNIDMLCQVLDLSREEFIGTADVANNDSDRLNNTRRIKKQKVFTILIGVVSAVALIMTIVTVLMGFICLTSNTGDMMDNSYSIPQYVFYVVLTVSVILILIDVGIIILKTQDKNKRL